MAPLLASNDPAGAAAAIGVDACPSEILSALGPLLCLHPAGDPHLLSGWSRARRLHAFVRLDSDGPSEALHFFSADGAPCWRLYLLPDSDFHAWERLLARLPVVADTGVSWRRFWPGKRSAAPRWRACALRLHHLADTRGSPRLAATDVGLSRLGESCARRIAEQAGIGDAGDPAPTRAPHGAC